MKAIQLTPRQKIIVTDYIAELKHCIDCLSIKTIETIITLLMHAYQKHRHVFIIGNGGSASNASHMACDLGKGTLRRIYDDDEPRFQVISLTDNVATLTAFSNDLSYEDIFVQQLRNLVEPDDIVIALSASGNSKNIIKAIKYAKKCNAKTIGIVGFRTGGKVATLVDQALVVNSSQYGIHEDISLIVNHLITLCIAQIKHEHDTQRKK